jgi:hypothetical protein
VWHPAIVFRATFEAPIRVLPTAPGKLGKPPTVEVERTVKF